MAMWPDLSPSEPGACSCRWPEKELMHRPAMQCRQTVGPIQRQMGPLGLDLGENRLAICQAGLMP